MIKTLKYLEPRFLQKSEIICEELDEVDEILFIEKGEINYGYEVNKQKFFKMRFGARSVIGAFNVNFNKRSLFVI